MRKDIIRYSGQQITIDDRDIWRLATLEVKQRLRGAQMADPEMTSALALLRRAANVIARLEDAVVFRGLTGPPAALTPRGGIVGLPNVWEIRGGQDTEGLWVPPFPPYTPRRWIPIFGYPRWLRGDRLVGAVSEAIGILENSGHFGPFAVVLGQGLFLIAQTPGPFSSFVLPQDRIIPFLGGGPLLRSSTLDLNPHVLTGLVMALGGAPFELVVATDISLQFLQFTTDPDFLFRVRERIALRIKESEAIVELFMWV